MVVAIMVVMAALAVPAIQRTFSNQTLRKGADRVRVAMGQARVRAIKHGEEYAVFISPGRSWFNVAPFASYQAQESLASSREQIAERRQQSDYEDDLLPRGVRFVLGETATDARSADAFDSVEPGGGVRAILFYPDGTSQDARVVLQNEKQQFAEVQLRGLTGVARTVRGQGNPLNR